MSDDAVSTMSEDALLASVRRVCGILGLWCYHTHDSRGSEPGFPDLVIVGRKVIFRELKSEYGRVSAEQRKAGSRLEAAGQDWAVWRPRDLLSGIIRKQLEKIRLV